MNFLNRIQTIGLVVLVITSLLYAGSKLEFVNLPTSQENVFGFITFIGVFILALAGTYMKKIENSSNK